MDLLKIGWIAGSSVLISGCQLSYYLHGAYNQSKIHGSRMSVERTLRSSKLSGEQKRKIRLIQEVKEFGANHLGLKTKSNYNSFVQIDRPYVTYIVQAAPAWELEPYLWKFPIVGKVPYKGYFSKELADKEARGFDPTKYDTYVRGVSAYSTLGWLEDPILSPMLNYEDHDLVELILHESVHTTVYLKGSADFNERMATYLGQEGMRRFYLSREGENSEALAKSRTETDDQLLFSKFLSKELDELKVWYVENSRTMNTGLKKLRLAQVQERFRRELKPKLKSSVYENFGKRELNNAVLLAYKTYEYDLDDFAKLFRKFNDDFKLTLKYLRELKSSKDPEKDLKAYVQSE